MRISENEKAYYKAIVETFPVHSHQIYRHGNHLVQCLVLSHSMDRIRVSGLFSGKEYWIHAPRFCE